MINYLYSTNTLYIVNVCTLCIVITISHIQWMCNPVRIYGNKRKTKNGTGLNQLSVENLRQENLVFRNKKNGNQLSDDRISSSGQYEGRK